MKHAHRMPFGAEVLAGGGTRFRLWAPSAKNVDLILYTDDAHRHRIPLTRGDGSNDGWYETIQSQANAGARYCYRINDALDVPDPASRSNPRDVHAASEIVDPLSYDWRNAQWQGRPWHEAVVYELHVGTFTQPGSFAAIETRLDALAKLRVTAIELMPVAEFPGARGWGYDGVLPFAPEARYGTPNDLKRLVDAAHARGLMMILDVVYNHFGPDGNYLHSYAEPFFTDRYRTPWGAAINFDGGDVVHQHVRPVRDFFLHNALYWLEEFRFDGLRVDAVHAIHDRSAKHFVEELIETVAAGPGRERHIHIILENHDNTARYLRRAAPPDSHVSVSQWNDDFHHTLHVIATGEVDGYYEDFAATPIAQLGRCLAEGFAYQGEQSAFAGGVPRGEPSRDLPPTAFVNFLQTHDQVGNRAFGERLAQLSSPEALRAAYAILLLAPQPPMLFMGEEFIAAQPFQYFCDFTGELARAVAEGRRREFGRFAAFATEQARESIPDPCALDTFRASKLHWSDRQRAPHRSFLRYVQQLLQLRHKLIVPLIPNIIAGSARADPIGARALCVTWPLNDGGSLILHTNLADKPLSGAVTSSQALIFSTARSSDRAASDLMPWETRWLHRSRA